MLQRGAFVLDPSSGNQPVQSPLGCGDGLDHAVQQLGVAHVNATVVEFGVQLLCCPLLDVRELRGLEPYCQRGAG